MMANADENLSPATKRLFNAVWTGDMARVKASIVDGAVLDAIDEDGVRPVDMAVDRGHYDIAHYLLSVKKVRDSQSNSFRRTPAPVSAQPVPASVPVPTPASVTTAPPSPVSVSQAAVSEPPPQSEPLWKPAGEGDVAKKPSIQTLGTTAPQPVSPQSTEPTDETVTRAENYGTETASIPKPGSEKATELQESVSQLVNEVAELVEEREKQTVKISQLEPPVVPAAEKLQTPKNEIARVVRSPVKTRKKVEPLATRSVVPKPTTKTAALRPVSSFATEPRQVKAPPGGAPIFNPAKIVDPMISSALLKDVVFQVGTSWRLGVILPKDEPRRKMCIDKSRWRTKFCIEPVIWPESVAREFQAESTIYRGSKAIVQYVDGQSVQLHVLFPAGGLWSITEYFKKLYGPPTEMPEIWTALIGAPKRPNRVLRWHNRDSKTGAISVLEIREIDDLRWSKPPDRDHGVVRILEKGRGSVFQLLSPTDLLLVNLRQR